MIVVSFENELREAFEAGQAAANATHLLQRKRLPPEYAKLFARTPKTYEDWIASIADRPAVVRG